MNQILYIDKSKKDNSVEIAKIAKISVIIIFIFAVIAIGKGVFGIINNMTTEKNNKPVVSVKEIGAELEISVKGKNTIDKIVYSWNGQNATTLQGKGRNEITETIYLPSGSNILEINVTDIEQRTASFKQQFTRDISIDTTEPTIEFVVEGSKVRIVVKDDQELSLVSYHWNDEDNTYFEPNQDYKLQAEEKIAILKGENTLTIEAEDAAGNKAVKQQIFKGATKPTVTVIKENNEIVIKIRDNENIQKIEMNLNGEIFSTDPENTGASLDMQEAEIRQPLIAGENVITVTAYNVSGLSEQVTKTITM